MKFSSNTLKIRESFIYDKNVKKDIKLVGVGDIHLSKIVKIKHLKALYNEILLVKPDYICLLGDIIDKVDYLNKAENRNNLKAFLYKLSLVAPVLVILGNHDFIYKKNKKDKENCDFRNTNYFWDEVNNINNVYLLDDKVYEDEKVFIGGYTQKIDAYFKGSSKKENALEFRKDFSKKEELVNPSSNKPKILICHSPELIESNYDLLKTYNVIICGHYHNGAVFSFLDNIYPKNKGFITPRKKLFPKYARGIRKLDNSYLVYSGGYTKIQETAPRILHPFDKLYNRQMDVVNIVTNKEYSEIIYKNKKLNLNY